MKLSMTLISSYLSKHYTVMSEITDDALNIRGVRFLSDSNQELSTEFAYVGRIGSFISDEKYQDTGLITNKRSRIICHHCDFEELLNDMFAVFDYYYDWEYRMMKAATAGESLQEMLDIIFDMIDKDILVCDLNGLILAKKIKSQENQDPYWLSFINEGIADPQSICQQLLTEDDIDFQMLTDKPQYLYTSFTPPIRFVATNLYVDGEAVAIVFVYEIENNTHKVDIQLMEVATQYLTSAAEFKGSNAMLQSNRSIMIDLLEGREISNEAILKFERLGEFTPPFALFSITHVTRKDRPVPIAVCRALTRLSVNNLAIEYEDDVVALTSEIAINKLTRELGEHLDMNSYFCGISMPVENPRELPIAYRQAKFARQNASTPGIYHCSEVSFSYLIKSLREQPMATELLHPALKILTKYDEKNGTFLLDTLECFLRNKCNHNQTARELFVHRNTLTHRLERIQKLTNVDFQQSMEYAYLCLSFWLKS